MMHNISALLCGILFGIGVSLSGMTDPNVVLGFLDLWGHWNPALLFVMMGAVPVVFIGYRWVTQYPSPLFSRRFYWPEKRGMDRPLMMGAVLFGIGWGLLGLCPGPAMASLLTLQLEIFGFVFCMVVGMLLVDWVQGEFKS